MGYHFFMYRCTADLRPFTKWNGPAQDIAEPIDDPGTTWRLLTELLPTLVREPRYESAGGWRGHATLPGDRCGFSVSTCENSAGNVAMIVTEHRAPPSILRAIMDRFDLDSCCSSLGDFRDPRACDDDWNLVPPR